MSRGDGCDGCGDNDNDVPCPLCRVVMVVMIVVIMTMMCRVHCVAVATNCQAAPTYRVHLSARVCQDGSHSRFDSCLNQIRITFQPDTGCMVVAVIGIVTDRCWTNR